MNTLRAKSSCCGAPVKRKGKQIPWSLRSNIRAMVCDDMPGLVQLGQSHGWQVQQCQFHLLKQLYRYRGRRLLKPEIRRKREAIFQMVRATLKHPDSEWVSQRAQLLWASALAPDIPIHLRYILHRFTKRLDYFRAWQRHPELQLPATTSSIESKIETLRAFLHKARYMRSPKSLLSWATAFLRLHPTIRCTAAHQEPN